MPAIIKNAPDKDNVAQYEFIPYILAKCADVNEAKELISKINITDTPFDEQMPAGQLHWIIADRNSAITVEIGIGRNKGL